jgi:serine/threonine-protein kinase
LAYIQRADDPTIQPTVSSEPPPQVLRSLSDRYLIEREVGAGGMATVYLAHDTRHDRHVALKVLRPELAAVIGAARFLAEIKTTANLQHPNILPLHDSGECDGTVYYVMPFVEGETLRDRLDREKQLPIADAVRIASAIAGALQYAHTHGVIHRDVKPENILLHDGHAVVADFGIALAASTAGSRMTQTGMSLGTPHYMSPEQAMGDRNLDARTDIYALGCVLYEMLVGEPPFTGATAQAIVARVITEQAVPPSKTRSTVLQSLDDAVLMALQKLPADRFASAAEFAAAISASSTAPTAVRVESAASARNPWRVAAAALAIVIAVLLAALGKTLGRASDSSAPSVYDAALPDSAPLSFFGARGTGTYGLALTNLSVTDKADVAVYAAARGDSAMLYRRSLRNADATPIPGTEGGSSAMVSPDGQYVVYTVDNRVMLTRASGGTPKQMLVVGPPATMQWLSDRQFSVLHTDGNRFAQMDIESGPMKQSRIERCTFGRFMPATNELLCSLNDIAYTIDVATSKRTVIRVRNADGTPGPNVQGSDFRLVGNSYVVFLSASGELHGAPYDASSHTIGHSVPLVSGVRREGAGLGQYAVAANGTLVYAMGADAEVGRMVTLRPGHAPEPMPIETARFKRFDLSADRRWLAAEVTAQQGDELRVYDMKNGQAFTWLRAPTIRHAHWNQDGTKLLFYMRDSAQTAILYGAPASAAPPETLFKARLPAALPDPLDFANDHTAIAIDGATDELFRFDPSARAARMDSVGMKVRFVTVSPGAKLLCYQSIDGRILVSTFPPGATRYQVASTGVEPLWLSPSEVLYRSGVTWLLARVNPTTGEPSGAPTPWGRDIRFTDTPGWSNRVSHDGGIIYAQGPAIATSSSLRVVPNWVSRMRATVDSANRRP